MNFKRGTVATVEARQNIKMRIAASGFHNGDGPAFRAHSYRAVRKTIKWSHKN